MKPPSTALARLASSRESLRNSLRERPAVGAIGGYLAGLKSLPGAALLFELSKTWWQQQPLGAAVKASLSPLARRHPFALVCGAAALGGLLVWARPWRLLKPALLAGLAQQLLSKALGGATLEACLAAFGAMTQAPPSPATATAGPATADAPARGPHNQ
ncbi:hypothetical protein LNV09_20365 [Paucibacter sp. B2R-40]|uniref:hypothetical protein n=1 Tax=Paucibacter sp. B2R-40 TaxID=2893554 RepID=UPI0021E38698|nr:hypothetical protein [Paucibacter sp. B2R-40]MCV2356502.1 hypothetical protein [Paucibacter sp. B2R-40]